MKQATQRESPPGGGIAKAPLARSAVPPGRSAADAPPRAPTAASAYRPQAACSPEEREQLILEHLPQVRLIARRIHERLPESVNLDDLVSTGVIGLIAASDSSGAPFSVFSARASQAARPGSGKSAARGRIGASAASGFGMITLHQPMPSGASSRADAMNAR